MINFNGVVCNSIEELEIQMQNYNVSEIDKQNYRNDFNGVLNTAINSIPPVTNQQLRSALVIFSYQQNKPNLHPDAIRSFIETLPEPNRSLAMQQWEYSNEMKRDNPLVNSMASSLQLTTQDLDGLWAYAKTL